MHVHLYLQGNGCCCKKNNAKQVLLQNAGACHKQLMLVAMITDESLLRKWHGINGRVNIEY